MKTFVQKNSKQPSILPGLFFIARPFEGAGTDDKKGIPCKTIVDQIKNAIASQYPQAIIFDPWDVYINDRNNLFSKTTEPGRTLGIEIYRRSLEIAAAADALIAYFPKRSMGTADEISAASRNGRLVICITPDFDGTRIHNWTVISHTIYPDNIFNSVNDFVNDVNSGGLEVKLLRQRRATTGPHLWLDL